MKKYVYILAVFAFIGVVAIVFKISSRTVTPQPNETIMEMNRQNLNLSPGNRIELPEPVEDGDMSLEKALTLRRSIRTYATDPLTLEQVSQLLWSAQGITQEERGFRTAPSAGATFPLEMFVVVNNVEELKKGVYHYHPHEHKLAFIRETDIGDELARAALSQSMVADGGAVFIFAAVFERTTDRYGERGRRYVYNEIGHASQNLHLQSAALELGTVVIGAYRDEEVESILQLGEEYDVLYLMPVGTL